MWKDHFKTPLSCVKSKNSSNVSSNIEFDQNAVVYPGEVEDAINKLAGGKSCGMDGIYAEHLKHCSLDYKALIAKCISSFF